jgi:hypothetical protein
MSLRRNFGAGSWPFSVAVGDFNGDGLQDLAVVNSDSNNVSVLINNMASSWPIACASGSKVLNAFRLHDTSRQAPPST